MKPKETKKPKIPIDKKTGLQVNTPAWWDVKCGRYVAAGNMRCRPLEFREAARFCKSPILEVGPAMGEFAAFLAPNDQWLGVELGSSLVGLSRERHPRYPTIRGDFLRIGAGWHGAFETIVAMQVLEHFPPTSEDKNDAVHFMKQVQLIARHRFVFSVPRGKPTPSARDGDGHLIGWEDNDELKAWLLKHDRTKSAVVEFFEGAANHICGVMIWGA